MKVASAVNPATSVPPAAVNDALSAVFETLISGNTSVNVTLALSTAEAGPPALVTRALTESTCDVPAVNVLRNFLNEHV